MLCIIDKVTQTPYSPLSLSVAFREKASALLEFQVCPAASTWSDPGRPSGSASKKAAQAAVLRQRAPAKKDQKQVKNHGGICTPFIESSLQFGGAVPTAAGRTCLRLSITIGFLWISMNDSTSAISLEFRSASLHRSCYENTSQRL
jgi:hypothetical protein